LRNNVFTEVLLIHSEAY